MTTLQVLENWLSPALVRALGYALLHSLWQGAVLAGLLAAALPLLRRHRPEVRYAASAAAIAGLLLAVGGTFGYYGHYQTAPAPAAPLATSAGARAAVGRTSGQALPSSQAASRLLPAPAPLAALARRAEPYLPVLVAAWLLGLLLMSGRLAGGLYYTGRLRRAGTQALGAEWQQRLAGLAARAGLRHPVALLESGRVHGPLVLGYLRPAILLPLGAVAGLPPALLEALLAHELAHIVRRDYVLNLALAATEAVFFYHPAVWFMAACLRAERENCCDDQAAALCGGDALRVARALAALAELAAATPTPRLALAAAGAGGRGSLLARVRRLALGRPQAPTLTEGLLAGVLCLLGVAGLGTGLAIAAPLSKSAARLPWQTAPADTTRRPAPPAPAAPAAPAEPAASAEPAEPAAPPVPPVPLRGWAAQAPPRRPARRIVLEKDKKGRVVSLTVDGQPVATGETGKKAKHGKTTSTVEIIEPNAGPAGWGDARSLNRGWSNAQPLNRGWSSGAARAQVGGWGTVDLRGLTVNPDAFRFSPEEQRATQDKALSKARAGLAKSLRNPDLTPEQRRAIEQAQRSLDEGSRPVGPLTYRLDGRTKGLQRLTPDRRQELHLNLDGQALQQGMTFSFPNALGSPADLAQTQREMQQYQREMADYQRQMQQYQRDMQAQQREAQADMRQAESDARQAQADARQALADARARFNGPGAPGARAGADRTAARRAQLEARIASAEAELRALDGAGATGRGRVAAPRPPQPPLAPVLPLGAPGPAGPALPAPPTPPTGPTTQELREELRRDGLLGKDERNFTFQLNEKELRVNGKVLTAAQAEKYRRLYQLPASSQGKGRRTVSITINEN